MPLSPEQKEAKKAVRRDRDRAWRARYREREAAEKLANDAVEAEHGPEIKRLSAAEVAARNETATALTRIDAEIEALRQRRKQCVDLGEIRQQEAYRPWREAWDRRRAAQAAVQRNLDRRFPDLVGAARLSAAAWAQQEKPS